MDNISTVLVNDLSTHPYNPNIAYNNSWVGVGGANFPLFAQASYITNLDDLTISLSAGHIELGDVNIADGITFLNATVNPIRIGYNGLRTLTTLADPNSDIFADVANIGGGVGALRVLSQDLTATSDSVSIGDHIGNYATITNSALNVFQTNAVSAVSVTNFPTQLTAVSVTNQLTGITVLNPVSSFSLTNTVSTIVVQNNPTALRTFNNFNNSFSINNAKIPVLAVRMNPNSGSTGYIKNYSILTGSSPGSVVLGYTWVQNPSAIGGSYTWNNLLSSNLQYTIFSEQPSPNSYSGGVAVHSGLVPESNLEIGDEISSIPLTDGSSPTVLLLAAQRLDDTGNTNFWFTVDVVQN
jgi:hypothetical protein